ncbi:MAG: hypothetical protein ACRENB_07220 [Gemmatimonadales bacterium]
MRDHDLLPPYQSLQPAAVVPPALGTVRLVDATSPATVAAAAAALAVSAPWCIPCAVLRGYTPDLLLETMPACHLRRTAILSVSPPGSPPSAFGILQAVAARPMPTAADVAEYVATRLGRLDAAPSLVTAMESDDADPTSAFVLRMLDGLGRLEPHEWRRVLWLARLATGSWITRGQDADGSVGLWTAVLLGLAPRALRELVGWEWVIERTLRVNGYVADPGDPARGGSRRDGPLVGPLAPTWHHRTVRAVNTPSGTHRIVRG